MNRDKEKDRKLIPITEIENCPFCGVSEDGIDHNTGQKALTEWELPNGEVQILCAICECRGPSGKHDKHAIELWNKRK